MEDRSGRVVRVGYSTELAELDRELALARGLTAEEAELTETSYSTGVEVADARSWYSWVRRCAGPQYLLALALGVPLVVIVILSLVSPSLANAAMPVITGSAIGLAIAWAANFVWSRLAPNVARAVADATTTRAEPHWARAVAAVAEVERRLGAPAAARFDDALAQLHPEALRLAAEAELRLRLGQDPASDPQLAPLLGRVRSQVELITTEAIRVLSDEQKALETRPVEWHPADTAPTDEPELANEEELR